MIRETPSLGLFSQQIGRGARPVFPSIADFQRRGLLLDLETYGHTPLIDPWAPRYELAWSPDVAGIPPMLRAVEPAEPAESASVIMLRTLLDARRATKRQAESSHKSRIRQAEDAERRAADLRERAKSDTETAEQADAEIAAVLADIEKLGGRPETKKES